MGTILDIQNLLTSELETLLNPGQIQLVNNRFSEKFRSRIESASRIRRRAAFAGTPDASYAYGNELLLRGIFRDPQTAIGAEIDSRLGNQGEQTYAEALLAIRERARNNLLNNPKSRMKNFLESIFGTDVLNNIVDFLNNSSKARLIRARKEGWIFLDGILLPGVVQSISISHDIEDMWETRQDIKQSTKSKKKEMPLEKNEAKDHGIPWGYFNAKAEVKLLLPNTKNVTAYQMLDLLQRMYQSKEDPTKDKEEDDKPRTVTIHNPHFRARRIKLVKFLSLKSEDNVESDAITVTLKLSQNIKAETELTGLRKLGVVTYQPTILATLADSKLNLKAFAERDDSLFSKIETRPNSRGYSTP